MTFFVKTVLFPACVFILSGCGGAGVKGGETPQAIEENVNASTSTALQSNNDTDTGDVAPETEILEKKTLEVAQVETLRANYLEMGFPEELASLLADTLIEFVVPDKFEKIDAVENYFWKYNFGLVAKSGKVEVRFKILPGENVGSAENGGNVSTANELMNVIIRLNGANLVADIQEHPGSEVSSRFNASSYTTGTFQPVPEFSDKLIGSAGLIYKEGRGRIIVVTLMDSMEDAETRTEWITGTNSIRFAEPPTVN